MKFLFSIVLVSVLSCAAVLYAEDDQVRLASLSRPPIDRLSVVPRWIRLLKGDKPLTLMLVEKKEQKVKLLQFDGSLHTLAVYPCATGKNIGRKSQNGDERTPEGIYFITKSYTDTKITVFGKRAFHLDYPNWFDANEGRDGNGIYIHGTNRPLAPDSTNGCITMRNDDLDLLVEHMEQQELPVVIVDDRRQLEGDTLAMSDINTLEKQLIPGEIAGLSHFDSLYAISDGRQTIVQGEYHTIREDSEQQHGLLRGYLVNSPEQGWILAQRALVTVPVVLEPERVKVAVSTLVVPCPESRFPRDEKSIAGFVESWRQAWQTKELEDYIECYDSSFTQGKMNLTAWRKYKKRLNKKYRRIAVSIDDINIDWTRNGARVLFHQVYESDKYYADGRKMLHLSWGKQGWRITREIWLN